MTRGIIVSWLGLAVSIPTWVLWLAEGHGYQLPDQVEEWLLLTLCFGMAVGMVASIGINLGAYLETGRRLYAWGAAGAVAVEAFIFGVVIYHRTADVFLTDLWGTWSFAVYIAIGGAYVVSVIGLPPVADLDTRAKRTELEERISELETDLDLVQAGRSELARQKAAAETEARAMKEKVEELTVQVVAKGAGKETIASRVLEAAIKIDEWKTAKEWAGICEGLDLGQVRTALSKHVGEGLMEKAPSRGGETLYAARRADGTLPEWQEEIPT